MDSLINIPAAIVFLLVMAAGGAFYWIYKKYPARTTRKPVGSEKPPSEEDKKEDEPQPPPEIEPAMVITDKGIVFRKIVEPLGNIWYLDPSMPKSGAHYIVTEKAGKLEAYDPRYAPLINADSPQRAYRAVMAWARIVPKVWNPISGIMDTLNSIFVWVGIAGWILVAMVAIDKWK